MSSQHSYKEHGNVLFIVLMGILLFGALSYALTNSSLVTSDKDKEKRLLNASSLVRYGVVVLNVVSNKIMSGTAVAGLDFTSSGTGQGAVFDAGNEGAAFIPDTSVCGSGCSISYFISGTAISGVGSAADEILVYMSGVSLSLCEEINNRLNLTNPPTADSDGTQVLIDAYPGKRAACFETAAASSVYSYYQVLLEN